MATTQTDIDDNGPLCSRCGERPRHKTDSWCRVCTNEDIARIRAEHSDKLQLIKARRVLRVKALDRVIPTKKMGQRGATKKARRRGLPWLIEDNKVLLYMWGEFHPSVIATRLGRTRNAVIRQAFTLGLGSPSKGTISLNEAERVTGYDVELIRRTAKYIGVTLERAYTAKFGRHNRDRTRGRNYAITEEQLEVVSTFLKSKSQRRVVLTSPKRTIEPKEWGNLIAGKRGLRWPLKCNGCRAKKRPPHALNMCERCYKRSLYKRKKKSKV